MQYLKPVVDDATSLFVHIIHTCIGNRVFALAWKIALVYPVLKVDHAKYVTELRPISILCILSKNFERVIFHQLCQLLEVEAHYKQTQSDFWEGHSISKLLLKFWDYI